MNSEQSDIGPDLSFQWNETTQLPNENASRLLEPLKIMHRYSFFKTFIVRNDHAALRWQYTIQKPSGR